MISHIQVISPSQQCSQSQQAEARLTIKQESNNSKVSAIVHYGNTKYNFSKVSTTVKRQGYYHTMAILTTV